MTVSSKATLAVITSKSFGFIFPRISYAHAWACVSGLDIRFPDGREITVSACRGMESGLSAAKVMLGPAVAFEEKRNSSGELLAFSADWRGGSAPANLEAAMTALSSGGYCVSYYPPNPFVDAFCEQPDKGLAMIRIKDASNVEGRAIYLGDSPADNSAFREADIAIGVAHGQPTEGLDCEYLVSFSDLPAFLGALSEKEMVFSPALPGVRRK